MPIYHAGETKQKEGEEAMALDFAHYLLKWWQTGNSCHGVSHSHSKSTAMQACSVRL